MSKHTNKIINKREKAKLYAKVNGKPSCSICNQYCWWNGKFLDMILDHVDGNPYNNTLNNLRLVCPNCNNQLPTTNRGLKYKEDEIKRDTTINYYLTGKHITYRETAREVSKILNLTKPLTHQAIKNTIDRFLINQELEKEMAQQSGFEPESN